MDLTSYRNSELETARTADLLRILPRGRTSVLDIGARDGYFSRLLTSYFTEVTALDLQKPLFAIPGVTNVAGDATRLNFPANSFDCVFCAEVLEHVPDVGRACSELIRVAKHEIIIGVPFRQDTRLGRTTCAGCGAINPPWGHVNSFDERALEKLFPGLQWASKSFVGINSEATNGLAVYLMDRAGNPWGTYNQEESCGYCGEKLVPPMQQRSLISRLCSAAAVAINAVQKPFVGPRGNWIHVVFSKGPL